MTEIRAHSFAQEWITASEFTRLGRYHEPLCSGSRFDLTDSRTLLGDSSGTVVGKEALLDYFTRGLRAYPNLAFTLLEVMWGVSSIVLHYVNQNDTKCGEFMEVAPDGKVVRVVAHYSS